MGVGVIEDHPRVLGFDVADLVGLFHEVAEFGIDWVLFESECLRRPFDDRRRWMKMKAIADQAPPGSFRLIVEGTGRIGFLKGESVFNRLEGELV